MNFVQVFVICASKIVYTVIAVNRFKKLLIRQEVRERKSLKNGRSAEVDIKIFNKR